MSSTCMASVPHVSVDDLERTLTRLGVGVRRWWRRGVHRLPAFRSCARSPLPNTERIADRYLGVPFYPDMSDAVLERILEATTAARAA